MSEANHKVYFVNRQVIGQRCGWTEASTKEEAERLAMEQKAGQNPCIINGDCWFDGGCIL